MDKTVLKNFAIQSRKDLMEKINRKIKLYYVDEDFKRENKGEIVVLSNDKHNLTLTKEEDSNRDKLIKRIKELGYSQVVEEAAYTWFNRIIAIRYMEIHDYLPLSKDNQSLGIKVLSSNENTTFPEILKFTNLVNPELDINFNKDKYSEFKNDDEKFKYILNLICKKIAKIIPQVFGGVYDYIELLIPDNMLRENNFIYNLITKVSIDNFENVEIIGWLYQYYNQAEKDRVISAKKAYKKNEIAYATQLFTPDWIVKYMVENSLGKYWIQHGGDENLKKRWNYYIDVELEKKELLDPTCIKFIDPCCGSGHILVYAFDVLYQIYDSFGYNRKDIAELILKNNIYGLDVDDRAGQLSILSIILKAREFDKNLFTKEIIENLNIMSIQESNNVEQYVIETLNDDLKENVKYLYDKFKNGKEIGSLTLIDNRDYTNIVDYYNNELTMETLNLKTYMPDLIKQANILSTKYNVIVTNPPYMNSSFMTPKIKEYLLENFKDVKSDLFSAFVIRNTYFGNDDSFYGFMTPYVWMFISSYEELRKYIINNLNINSLIQLEYSSLEEATVPICTFVLDSSNNFGKFFKLTEFAGGMKVQEKKFIELNNSNDNKYVFTGNSKKFAEIPGNVIAFWISKNFIDDFNSNKKFSEYAEPKSGVMTGDDAKFIRFWSEVDYNKFDFSCKSSEDMIEHKKKWFPVTRGGKYRKWYGNIEEVVNLENEGFDIIHNGKNYRLRDKKYYMKQGLTWTMITSYKFSVRYVPEGILFGNGGPTTFVNKNLYYFIALLNSEICNAVTKVLNPTLNTVISDVCSIPIIFNNVEYIEEICKDNINISKKDWDSFEQSWDFKIHPLLQYNLKSLKDSYLEWEKYTNSQFALLKNNEEEINKIFINTYNLKNEISYKVLEKDVTIRKADQLREIKSLISYAVGCMFGRYSLDKEGLIFAGGEFDISKYNKYIPDDDNIIPISDNSDIYYNDDIVDKFKNFIKVTLGSETLNENLDYIAEILGKRGTESNEDTIRRYFVNDFYNDHLKIYQNRPIYWMFDSGKKNGFKCLIYMHRYDEQCIPKIRTKYLHATLATYQNKLNEIDYRLNNEDNLSINEKRELQNKKVDLNNKITECNAYEEKVAHIANMSSEELKIDLDEGVIGCAIKDEHNKPVKNENGIEMRTGNYYKFIDILAKIK